MAHHTFWYKILDAPPPEPLPETLPLSPLDAKDGFIHLSTAQQTPTTANLFFSNFTKLWLLKLRVGDIDGEVRFPPNLPGCPHIHDSLRGLGKGNVEKVVVLERKEGEAWTDVKELGHLDS